MANKSEVNGESTDVVSDANLSKMSKETDVDIDQLPSTRKSEEPSKVVPVNYCEKPGNLNSSCKAALTKPKENDEFTESEKEITVETSEVTNSPVVSVLPSDEDGKPSPQRRMSLRSRSIPKKYSDSNFCGDDEPKDIANSKDPLEISPVKALPALPAQKSSITVTTLKSPNKTAKQTKVTRPPPELIKAPVLAKLPISSATSVTVVPRTKGLAPQNESSFATLDSPYMAKPKTSGGIPSLPASVTVSTVPSSTKSLPKAVQLPTATLPVRKNSSTGNVNMNHDDPLESLGLSNDSFIVEAPSFVVPYLIEKCSEEKISKLQAKPCVANEKKSSSKESSSEDESNDSNSKDDDRISSSEKLQQASSEVNKSTLKPDKAVESTNHNKEEEDYFSGAIGRFFLDIGLSLVQEHVQGDLLRVQKRKVHKGTKISDPSLSVDALSKGLEITKSKNKPLRLPLLSCDRCNFKSDSKLVMAHHWSLPLTLSAGTNLRYACHWCTLETKDSLSMMGHIEADHGIKSLAIPDLAPHQCPLCPFEDIAKSKVTRHMMSCQKRFVGDRNLEPPLDWEPPAKIPRMRGLRAYPGIASNTGLPLNAKGLNVPYHSLLPLAAHGNYFANPQTPIQGKGLKGVVSQMQTFNKSQQDPHSVGSLIARGFTGMSGGASPSLLSKPGHRQNSSNQPTAYSSFPGPNSQVYQTIAKSFQLLQGQVSSVVPNSGGIKHLGNISVADKIKKTSSVSSVSMVPGVLNTSGLTIQSAPTPAMNKPRSNQQPSISITPLPRATPAAVANKHTLPSNPVIPVGESVTSVGKNSPASKPAQSGALPPKGVVCEICDNSIKDLEQLRHHMQWIHKVKIHPKMIHNRPPLNCQKCQCRFFTDQGLERHLLGSHGLVTSSMQEAANRGQDGGRCPICGKVHQWKLLSHVVKDHGLSLKPAHLSYKCTVCTATFTMYKLFENHVYTAHSVVARKVLDKEKTENKKGTSTSNSSSSGVLRINDEITIIPQAARHDSSEQNSARSNKAEKRGRVDVIDLSDDEDQDDLHLPKSQVTITKVPAPKSSNKNHKESSSKRCKQDNPMD